MTALFMPLKTASITSRNCEFEGRAFDLEFRAADDVDFLLPNRQRLERVVVLLPFVAQPLGPAAGSERVGELRDGEECCFGELA